LPAEELVGVRVRIYLCRLLRFADGDSDAADGDGQREMSGDRSSVHCVERLDGDRMSD